MNEQFFNKHYISIDSNKNITDGFSTAFRQPVGSDILINDMGGYQFRLFPDGEENPQLLSLQGVPLYHWNGARVQPRTAEEIAAEAPLPTAPVPTLAERVAICEDAIKELSANHFLPAFQAMQVQLGNVEVSRFTSSQQREIEQVLALA